MFRLALALHLVGAAVWIGGHLVLCVTVLPRAMRHQDPNPIREFEEGYEPLGVGALILQIITGLWLAYHWLPDFSAWFSFEPALSRDIFFKFILLVATVLLAAHARLRIHPRLAPHNLGILAVHIVTITVLSLLFLITGIAIRTGGWW